MIREATMDDMLAMAAVGIDAYLASGLDGLIPYDANSFFDVIAACMESGVVLVIDDNGIKGIAAAMFIPLWLNRHKRVAQEVVFHITNKTKLATGRLFLALERACKEKGAEFLLMSHMPAVNSDKEAVTLIDHGYSPIDKLFLKEL